MSNHTDRHADRPKRLLACVPRVAGSWVRGRSRLSLQPHTPGTTSPMCPGSVCSFEKALSFWSSSLIHLLMTSIHQRCSSSMKTPRPTHYNSGPTSSSRHGTLAVSFLFLVSARLPVSGSSSCFLPLILSVYTLLFSPPLVGFSSPYLTLGPKSKHPSECQWQDNGVLVVALLLMLDPLTSSVCFTNIVLPTCTSEL